MIGSLYFMKKIDIMYNLVKFMMKDLGNMFSSREK